MKMILNVVSFIICSLILSSVSSLPTDNAVKFPHEATILKENRYLFNGGKFGTSYVQNDGTSIEEEADENGNRKGSYTYIDPEGKQRALSYTAGVGGFRVIDGDVPVAPVPQFNAVPVAAPVEQIPAVQHTEEHGSLVPFKLPVGYQLQTHLGPNSRTLPGTVQYQYQTIVPDKSFQAESSVPVESQSAQSQISSIQPEPSARQLPTPQLISAEQQPQIVPVHPIAEQYHHIKPVAFIYPPAKVDLNRSPEGFSYTFNSIV